jgi:hypothetical protein
MTDDLVKRLRAVPRDYDLYDHDIIYEAADRIEELEAALRLIANTDPAGDQHWPGRMARFVLDGGAND